MSEYGGEDNDFREEIMRDLMLRYSGDAVTILAQRQQLLIQRINDALNVIVRFGGIDGDHHKAWVLDQAVRHLVGKDRYEEFIKLVSPDGYGWEEGIAP